MPQSVPTVRPVVHYEQVCHNLDARPIGAVGFPFH